MNIEPDERRLTPRPTTLTGGSYRYESLIDRKRHELPSGPLSLHRDSWAVQDIPSRRAVRSSSEGLAYYSRSAHPGLVIICPTARENEWSQIGRRCAMLAI